VLDNTRSQRRRLADDRRRLSDRRRRDRRVGRQGQLHRRLYPPRLGVHQFRHRPLRLCRERRHLLPSELRRLLGQRIRQSDLRRELGPAVGRDQFRQAADRREPDDQRAARFSVGRRCLYHRSSPTGAWAGTAAKIAICEAGTTFTIYTPTNGWSAYDKATNNSYTFNGTAWISGAGSWINRQAVATSSGSTSFTSGSTNYTYSATVAPTTAVRGLNDTATLSFQARASGNTLRFHYAADVTFSTGTDGPGAGNIVIALLKDSNASAIDWQRGHLIDSVLSLVNIGSAFVHLDHWFEIAATDALSHTYSILITSKIGGAGNNLSDVTSLTRRTFEVEESGS
jgi:hypothetical protein